MLFVKDEAFKHHFIPLIEILVQFCEIFRTYKYDSFVSCYIIEKLIKSKKS